MYPSPVIFTKFETKGGALVTWGEPASTSIRTFIVYRSATGISAANTEAFYTGTFASKVERMELAPDSRALWDQSPPLPAWYLVQAIDESGDLVSVPHSVSAIEGELRTLPEGTVTAGDARPHSHNIYGELPPLVYRDDDPTGQLSMRTMARSLSARHDAKEDGEA